MADNNLQVKISADVTSLQAQSAVAKAELTQLNASVKDLAQQFVAASDEMKGSLAPQLEAAAAMATKAKAEFAALNAEIRNSANPEATGMFGKMSAGVTEAGEKIEGLTNKLSAFTGIFGKLGELAMVGFGAEVIGEQINKVAELGEAYAQLTEKTGATTQQLAALKLASMETNTDFDTVGNALRKLGQNMQAALVNPSSVAAQAFMAMGVKISDSSGQMLPVVDVFSQISTAMASYTEGTAKADLAGDVLGQKFGSSLIPVMNQVGSNFEELQARAQSLGIVMSQQDIDASEQFMQAQKDLSAALVGVRTEIVAGSLPAFTVLEQAFISAAQDGGALKEIGEVLGATLKGLAEIAVGVVTGVTEIADGATFLGHVLGDVITVAAALGEALAGDFSHAAGLVESATSDMSSSWTNMTTQIMAQEKLFDDTHNALWSGIKTDLPEAKPQTQAAPAVGGGDTDWMKTNQAALDAENEKIMSTATTTKQANAEKLANTVQYWQGVLEAGNLTAAQELQAQDALSKAEMALHQTQLSSGVSASKSAASQQTEIAQAAADARKKIAADEYAAQVSTWDAEVAQKKISKAQEISDEIAAQNSMYQTELAAEQKEAALDADGTAAKAKELDQIQELTAAHTAEIAKLNDDLVNAQIQQAKLVQDAQTKAADATTAAWQKAFQPITQAFDSSINGILQGTQTLQQAETKAAESIALAFIDAEAKKLMSFVTSEAMILARGVATQMGLTSAVVAGNSAQLAAKTTADAAGRTQDIALGTAQVAASANKAAAGAYSAVAGIPLVGPFLAPAAAATAYAGVMAFDVLSAEGGMAIPAGVNPLTQLHENEMVLPAYIAQPLSAMATGGTSTDNSSSTSLHFHQTNHMGGGGQDVRSMMAAAGKGIMDQVIELGRNGTLRLPGR